MGKVKQLIPETYTAYNTDGEEVLVTLEQACLLDAGTHVLIGSTIYCKDQFTEEEVEEFENSKFVKHIENKYNIREKDEENSAMADFMSALSQMPDDYKKKYACAYNPSYPENLASRSNIIPITKAKNLNVKRTLSGKEYLINFQVMDVSDIKSDDAAKAFKQGKRWCLVYENDNCSPASRFYADIDDLFYNRKSRVKKVKFLKRQDEIDRYNLAILNQINVFDVDKFLKQQEEKMEGTRKEFHGIREANDDMLKLYRKQIAKGQYIVCYMYSKTAPF